MSNPIRITHLITGLNAGGAEIMLLRLLSATDRARFDADVISMMEIGNIGDKIRDLGFRVRTLGLRRDRPNPLALPKLLSWLRQRRPDVLATWMYHANFLGSLAAPFAGGMPVVWGVHHGHLDTTIERPRTVMVARACGWMSWRMVSKIICCSECTRQEHLVLGYDPSKMIVIRNGFDMTAFHPDRSGRAELRRSLQIEEDAPMLFFAGRFHAQKDFPNFIAAAAILQQRMPTARFVLCGYEVTWQNPKLAGWIDDAGLRDCFRLLGIRDDVPQLLNASDIFCSASTGEGFSLAIGEAMSCGIPCVVTDVGDSAFQVADTGRAVPKSNPQAFADGCSSLLEMPADQRIALGLSARRRIEDHFALARVTEQYQQLYESVARPVQPGVLQPDASWDGRPTASSEVRR